MAGGYIDERTDKMDKNQISKLKLSFDEISHFTDDGVEFWYARELQSALGYVRSVSYTHLDVYKRQALNHLSSTAVRIHLQDRTVWSVLAALAVSRPKEGAFLHGLC